MRAFFLNLLSVIAAVLLLPAVYTATANFYEQIIKLPAIYQQLFVAGIVTFLVLHLFIVPPRAIYTFGQSTVGNIFKLSQPIAAAASLFLPFFVILLGLAMWILSIWGRSPELSHYLIFFMGLGLILHLVFTAQALNEGEGSAAKPTYYLLICLVYLVSLTLTMVFFGLVFSEFSVKDFVTATSGDTWQIYTNIYRQLFIPS